MFEADEEKRGINQGKPKPKLASPSASEQAEQLRQLNQLIEVVQQELTARSYTGYRLVRSTPTGGLETITQHRDRSPWGSTEHLELTFTEDGPEAGRLDAQYYREIWDRRKGLQLAYLLTIIRDHSGIFLTADGHDCRRDKNFLRESRLSENPDLVRVNPYTGLLVNKAKQALERYLETSYPRAV